MNEGPQYVYDQVHKLPGRFGSRPEAGDRCGPTWIDGRKRRQPELLRTPRNWALRFDGLDYVEVPDTRVLEPQHVTLECWLRRDLNDGRRGNGLCSHIVGKGAAQMHAASYALYTGYKGGMGMYDPERNVTNGFAGDIDEVTIWDRVLTDAEIAQHAADKDTVRERQLA